MCNLVFWSFGGKSSFSAFRGKLKFKIPVIHFSDFSVLDQMIPA